MRHYHDEMIPEGLATILLTISIIGPFACFGLAVLFDLRLYRSEDHTKPDAEATTDAGPADTAPLGELVEQKEQKEQAAHGQAEPAWVQKELGEHEQGGSLTHAGEELQITAIATADPEAKRDPRGAAIAI